MANQVQLTVRMNADGTGLVTDVNQVSRAFRQLDDHVERTGRGTTNLGRSFSNLTPLIRSVGAALGGLTLGAGIFSGVRTLADFSQEMSTLRAVSGATEEQFKRLRAEAEDLGATTRFSATQAAEGATFLARAGFDAQEVLSSLHSTLLLAQAGALELGSAADIASNVLQGFRLEAEEMNRVVDVLALGANRTNTNVEQLGQAMSFVAPAAAAVGVSVEEATAAVGALSDAGIQAERAGTGLRQILIQLEAAGGDLSVQANGLTNVLETLAERNIGLSEATELVGVRQASALLVLIDAARKVQDLTGEYEKAEGTAARVAETMDDNLNGALLATRSAVEAVTLAMGNLGAESSLTGFFQGLAGVLRTTAENMDVVVDSATLVAVAIGARMVPAIQSSIVAQRAAIAESIRYQATLARMAGVSGRAATAQIALGTAAGGVRAVMGALGGPVGVALTAATAIALFGTESSRAGDNADELSARVEKLTRNFEKLNEEAQKAARAALAETIRQIEAEIEAGENRLARGGKQVGGRGNSFLPGGVLVSDSDEEVVELNNSLIQLREELADARSEMAAMAGVSEIVIEGFERAEGSIRGSGDAMEAAAASADNLSIAKDRAQKAFRALAASVRDTDQELDRYNQSVSDLLDDLFPLQRAQREYNAELKLLDQVFSRGELTADEYALALRRLKERHAELFPEVQRSIDQSDEWAEAWEEATERIDAAFADAWKGAFDSFGDFADRLKDAFKNLLAEMAHFAITRPILVNMGLVGAGSAPSGGLFGNIMNSAFGGGQGGAAGGGGGLLGAVGGGLSALGGGLNQGLLAGRSAVLGGLNNLGLSGAANFFGQGTANLARLPGGLGGGLALSGLAGFAGTELAGALGLDTGIGSTAGSLGGTLLGAQFGAVGGPIGALAGALIGALGDTIFGGDGKKRFNAGIVTGVGVNNADFDRDRLGSAVTAASGLRLQTFNRRAGSEGTEAANALLETVLGLDEALTTLTSAAGIDVDFSRRTLQGISPDAGRGGTGTFFGLRGFNGVEGTLEGAADQFVSSWLDQVNEQLPRRVQRILQGVDQTAEALVGAFEASLAIDDLLDLDVVKRTEEALKDLGQANVTLLDRYDDLTQAAIDASSELDGSAEGIAELAGVLRDQKVAAAELAAAYRTVGIESDQILGNTIQSLRESLLSEEELYELRRQQIRDLTAEAGRTTDPEELVRIRDQVIGFTRDAVGLLDEGQQDQLVPGIVQFLERFNETIQGQVGVGLGELSSREGALRGAIDQELAARNQMTAATQGATLNLQQFSDQLQLTSQEMAEAVARIQQAYREAITPPGLRSPHINVPGL